MFSFFARRAQNRRIVERIHDDIVAAARDPALFTDYGVADTFEGRFETLTLFATLVLRRLNAMASPAPELAQDVVNALFRRFDATLREMGVGDPSVPKRMKRLAEAFLGRGLAYDRAARAGAGAFEEALRRNVYAERGEAARLARYVDAVRAALDEAPLEVFVRGPLPFPDPRAVA